MIYLSSEQHLSLETAFIPACLKKITQIGTTIKMKNPQKYILQYEEW